MGNIRLDWSMRQYIGSLAVNFLNRQRGPKQMSFCGFFFIYKEFWCSYSWEEYICPALPKVKEIAYKFNLEWGETEIRFLQEKGTFKMKITFDRHCPRLQ